MSKFKTFRPAINALEDRSLMSVSPVLISGDLPEPATIKLQDVLVSSFQSGDAPGIAKVGTGTLTLASNSPSTAIGSSGMSAGKVSYSDLSVMLSVEGGTFRDLLGRPVDPAADGGHKGHIDIQSWSFGPSSSGAGAGKAKFNEFTIKKISDSAVGATLIGTGTREFNGVQVDADAIGGTYQRYLGREADATGYSGSHALYQDVTIPASATDAGFHRLFGDANGDLANAPETGAMAKAVIFIRKAGGVGE